jgi:hypothetical protein
MLRLSFRGNLDDLDATNVHAGATGVPSQGEKPWNIEVHKHPTIGKDRPRPHPPELLRAGHGLAPFNSIGACSQQVLR